MIYIFILVILVLVLYFQKEGFTASIPTSYSTQTIELYTKYIKQNNPTKTDASIKSDITNMENLGVPESSINTFITTNKWPISDDFKAAYLKSVSNAKIEDIPNSPEEMNVQMLSKFYGNISLSSLRPLNLMCKTDASGNSIGEGIYTIKDSVADQLVSSDDLLIKAPGFTFLKDPCNPCDILNGNYDCPFAVPGTDKKPLLPNSILSYAWNIE